MDSYNNKTSSSHIARLPLEIIAKILFYVPPGDIVSCKRTCKTFQTVVDSVTFSEKSRALRKKMCKYIYNLEKKISLYPQ